MRYRVSHIIRVDYDPPVRLAHFNLRLAPIAWPGQQVRDYRLIVDPVPDVRQERVGAYPFNLTRDGRVVGIMPVDALSWTENTSKSLSAAAADAKRQVPNARGELRISGQATALAKQKLKALGWNVVENVRF